MGVVSCSRWRAANALLASLLVAVHTGCARTPARAAEHRELGAPIPRLFSPRLSVATDYVSCSTVPGTSALVPSSKCVAPNSAPPEAVLERAQVAAQQLAQGPEVGALRVAALVDLEWSADSGIALDRSISYLRTAADLSTHPAASLADLSAAYLVRAERTENVGDLLEAVEAASLSLSDEPSNLAATFNRALALEEFGLTAEARHAWSQYLQLDSSSGWGREALAHQTRLRPVLPTGGAPAAATPLKRSSLRDLRPERASQVAWDQLLGRWGEAELAGDTVAAAEALRRTAQLADGLIAEGSDPSVADAVSAIRAAGVNRERRRALARAHAALARAQQLSAQANYSSALTWAERASAEPHASRPLRARSQLTLSAMLMYAGKMGRAERIVRANLRRAEATGDMSVAARARWILGTIYLRTGRYEAAFEAYRSAEPLFQVMHQRENAGAVLSLAAETAVQLGNSDTAFTYTRRAAATLADWPGSLWRHSLFAEAAAATAAAGLPHAALAIAEESVHAADANGLAVYRIESRLSVARLLSVLGDSIAALRQLSDARALASQVPAGSATRWIGAELQLTSSTLRPQDEIAMAEADSAARTFGSLHVKAWLVPALLQRAELGFTRGRTTEARFDLRRAVGLLNSESSHISDVALRATFLESTRKAFDHELLVSLRSGDTLGALEVLERERAATKPEAFGGAFHDRIDRPSPQKRVILDFALVGDTILCWRITGGQAKLSRIIEPAHQLHSMVKRAQSMMEMGDGSEPPRAQLTTLYDRLLRSILATSADASDITIVADGELASIPFAALYDTVTHSYLIERHTIRYAESLRDALRPETRARPGAVVFVSDPAFDQQRFAMLSRLPGAVAEAAVLSREYPRLLLLQGERATTHSAIQALRTASLFYYAGHALYDDRHPEHSVLLLAPDPTSVDGTLSAATIAHMRLALHPLVVLSACETMHAGTGHSGDVVGLAQAFLQSGARGVIGSQWRASDRATGVLMSAFYSNLRRTRDAARALRAAQITLIHSQDPAFRPPTAWAGFRYAGE